MKLSDMFGTKIQTNAIITSLTLVGIQVFILVELNGQLAAILTNTCPNPLVIGTIFSPVIGLVVIAKTFANRKGNYDE